MLAQANGSTFACETHVGTLRTLQNTVAVAVSEVHTSIGHCILVANHDF